MAMWTQVTKDMEQVLEELIAAGDLQKGQCIVIGASTSEMIGQRIGTVGAEEAAKAVFEAAQSLYKKHGIYVAFQCCEHLNRALVVDRLMLKEYDLEEVTVVPAPEAGGSMAAYAFRNLADACVVETIQAHAGIDIGGTLIGMHLRRVAVPFRPSIRQIGQAPIIVAYTRPKLIGGARAKYALASKEYTSE